MPALRAGAVLVAFVVLTVLLLGVVHPRTISTAARSTSATTPPTTQSVHSTSTTSPSTTTTTPSHVPVLVANASGVTGAAAAVTAKLRTGGWDLLSPVNATARLATSRVYYVAGLEPAAASIASSLHLPVAAVAPYTTAAPINAIGTAEVVVAVGPDLSSPTSTTTTAAAAGTTTTTAGRSSSTTTTTAGHSPSTTR